MKKAIPIYLAYLLFFSCILTACAQKGTDLLSKYSRKTIDGKEYFLYVVKETDGIGSICIQFSVTDRELNNANPEVFLTEIKPNMTIKVPVLKWVDNIAQHDEFVFHTILRDQSIYFISKKYNLEINDIYANNPDVKNGIKIGLKLKLPNNPITLTLANLSEDQLIKHIVRANETLLSIAQTFGVDIGTIQQLNPSIAEGLKPGQVVKIPKNDATVKIENSVLENGLLQNNTYPCSTYNYSERKDTFEIAIMLPFELPDNEKLNTLVEDFSKSKFTRNSEKILEYYEGMLMAVDSLRQIGMNISLHVFDTEKNAEGVKKAIAKPEMAKMDLIIGPAYAATLKFAADFALKNKINIVSPLSQNDELLTVNNFLFQAKPSIGTTLQQMAQYLSLYADQNLILLHTNTPDEIEFVKTIKLKASANQNSKMDFKEVNYITAGMKGLNEQISDDKENYIVIPSLKEAYVTDILTKLNGLAKSHKIVVFGMQDWQKFNLDLDYFLNLQVHFVTNSFINYSDAATIYFVEKYRNSFMTDPSPITFQGYELMLYFGSTLMKYGKDFQGCISSFTQIPLKPERNSHFNFQKVSPDGGFENHAVQIIRYDPNYNLILIDPTQKTNYFEPAAIEEK